MPQYIRQMLTTIKEEIDSNTIILGDLNTYIIILGDFNTYPHLHQWTDHPDRKSIRKHRPSMTH